MIDWLTNVIPLEKVRTRLCIGICIVAVSMLVWLWISRPWQWADVENALTIIRDSESWRTGMNDGPKQQQRLVASFERLQQFDLPVIRHAIERYLAEVRHAQRPIENTGQRLYVMNRVVFDVPPEARTAGFGTNFWGRMLGSDSDPKPKEWFDSELWPLWHSDDGELLFEGHFGDKDYVGPPYDPISEFDFFSKKYGRRTSDGLR